MIPALGNLIMTTSLRHILRTLSVTIILTILSIPLASAQATKVKGRVVDASTGEGIPFAGIYFLNSTVGVSADMDGYYFLETRDTLTMLSASILGYEEQVARVNPHRFNEINFSLKPVVDELNAAVVKPDDRYMRSILRKIDEAKSRNNPERRQLYSCDVYTKMELDITNPESRMISGFLPKEFKFVYDYMDTSVVSGMPFLPVLISETTSKYYHRKDPPSNREIIKATRISGVDKDPVLAQFTGNMYVKTNFYDNYINIFQVEIPSPLSSSGMTYYNYYLVDSLQVEGRKTYKIRFHPSQWVSSPTFDGEMSIDAEEYALRDIHVRLKKGSNVNWVRDMTIDVVNSRLADSTWFYKQDRMYVDFSPTMRDSSKIVTFLGNRQIDYSNPDFVTTFKEDKDDISAQVKAGKDVMNNDEEYWQSVRPFPLSEKERGIYNMVDSIKNVPLYKDVYAIAEMLVNGFLNTKYVGFGPYSSLYSFNELEGGRIQLGARTTKDFSRKVRFMGYAAYGFKDKTFKGGGTFEYMFNNQPTSKLTLSYKHDAMQLGKGPSVYGGGSLMSSVLAKANSQKMSMVNDYALSWQKEWSQNFNMIFSLESRRIFSNPFVPMVSRDGNIFNSVGYNQAHVQLRFSKDEIVTRGVFDKHYMYSKYPVVTLDLIGSTKGIGKNEYSYFRPELSIQYTLPIPPLGLSKFNLSSGTIVGKVPYPMLKIHEGNGTYTFSRYAFNCMNYYEFASDLWTTFFWEHNFKGFFLGKIPLLKRLQWREVASLRAAYGTVRRQNNGIIGDDKSGAVMLFPEKMGKLNRPYIEMGAGITNIFRILRIDAFWRMTHRYEMKDGVKVPHDNRFVVTFGLEFKF